MQRGSRHPQDLGSSLNWQHLSARSLLGRLKARHLVTTTQSADITCRVGLSMRSLSILAIENAGNGGVRIVSRQTAHERYSIFIGLVRRHILSLQTHFQFGDHALAPTECEIGAVFLALHLEDDFLQKRTQKFFAVAIGCCGCCPNESQIGTERMKSLSFFFR